MIKKIQFLIIVMGVIMVMSKNAFSEWKGCIYDYARTGEENHITVVIGKFCGPGSPAELVIEKLDLSTGAYETVNVLHNPPRFGVAAVNFPANIAILDNNRYGVSYDVISLSTMKVLGKITVDVSPETDLENTGAYMILSPDGSRIFVNWDDGPKETLVTEVFDSNTFKKIAKYSSALIIGGFSNDGRYAYLVNTGNEQKISVLDLSTIQISKVIQLPELTKHMSMGNTIKEWGDHFDSNIAFHRGQVSYVYSIDTGALSVSIPTHEECNNSYLSPKADWMICVANWLLSGGKTQVDIYNVTTGKWAETFSPPVDKVEEYVKGHPLAEGAIISWPNDHTFIYNTTQKLIYFDIKQNKIVKELPIIMPWEKPGWKPEVGK